MNSINQSKSSYYRLRSSDPISWHLMGPDPFKLAQTENKPLYLCLGYAAHTSCLSRDPELFKDPEIAEKLNQAFVPVLIDRDEFPDLDHYYQLLSRFYGVGGGHSLHVFLLPDLTPIFVCSGLEKYSIKTERPDGAPLELPGFRDVIEEVSSLFLRDQDRIKTQAQELHKYLQDFYFDTRKVEYQGHFPSPSSILAAVEQFSNKEEGGYGQAPLFPLANFFEWTIEQMLEGVVDKKFGDFTVKTLENMLCGGIMDHVRGGIFRYSKDKSWAIPNFEKSIHDQAALLKLLSKFSLIYPSGLVFEHIQSTLEYLESEMMDDEGQFFSSQAGISEDVEGLYFTYTLEEFQKMIEGAKEEFQKNHQKPCPLENDKILSWFEIVAEGNFERGLNIFRLPSPSQAQAFKDEIFTPEAQEFFYLLKKEGQKLRRKRIPPLTDPKGVASWNFYLTTALADVIQYCRVEAIHTKASNLLKKSLPGQFKSFLIHQENEDKKFTSIRHSNSLAHGPTYLEDFVYFAQSQIRLYEISADESFLLNFLQAMEVTTSEFFKEVDFSKLQERPFYPPMMAMIQAHPLAPQYPEALATLHDREIPSSLALFLGLCRRARLLLLHPPKKVREQVPAARLSEFLSWWQMNRQLYHAEALKNPLISSEALRSFTYPDHAYRVIKLPSMWIKNAEFIKFSSYFLHRFILAYHQENTDHWHIYQEEKEELSGVGPEDFIKALSAPQDPKKA